MTQFYSRNDVKYNGDVYSIPFDYIKEQEIQVYLDNVLFTDWSFLQKSQIKLNKIPEGVTNKTIVSVRRVTDISKKEVDYSNNTLLDKASLNTSQDQLLHAVQEIYDNNISFGIDATAQIATNKADTDAQIEVNKQELLDIQENYEQENNAKFEAYKDELNTKIATVADAADKINTLDESIQLCENSAEIATEQAQIAIDKTEEILNVKDELETEIDTKANRDLSNLSTIGQAKFDEKAYASEVLKTNQITNCLLEVPQRIKLELNDGVLTLKAGSQVIVPNGFEEDGVTPRFDYLDIDSDKTYTATSNGTCALFYTPTLSTLNGGFTSVLGSGTSVPTTGDIIYYKTDINTLAYYKNGILQHSRSFPLALFTVSNNTITSITQTFNGLGYIGSTVWVDKGVKGLIPNGRNEDRTLRNIEYTTDKLYVDTAPSNVNNINTLTFTLDHIVNGIYYPIVRDFNYFQQSTLPTYTACLWYNPDTNEMYSKRTGFDGGILKTKALVLCEATYVDGKITSFNPKQPFRAIDYSDSSEVSGWGMPSGKYIDLTLGAPGATYTAPANGWIVFCKLSDAANQFLGVGLNVANFNQRVHSSASGQMIALMSPVSKNAKIYVTYSVGGDTKTFRFYYAEGEV